MERPVQSLVSARRRARCQCGGDAQSSRDFPSGLPRVSAGEGGPSSTLAEGRQSRTSSRHSRRGSSNLPTWAELRGVVVLRRRFRLGRHPYSACGPVARALGRGAASYSEWASIRRKVLARAGWRCQASGVQRRLDIHHIVKRSQGGSTST